jgi:hypothetical protein
LIISLNSPLNLNAMKKILLLLPLFFLFSSFAPQQEFYEIRIYHLKTDAQEKAVESFLKTAYLPALHKVGITNVGVFKPVEPDTADRKIYVIVPLKNLDQLGRISESISGDKKFQEAGKDYLGSVYNKPPYTRIESIVLKAFSHNPVLQLPQLKGPRSERIYELRSYESYTENIFRNKVHMFNEGGEVALFKRLGFNAVFYAEVLSGPRMPNLMYMTTFENKVSREEHWKTFVDDPEWKKLSSMPEYQNNVSRIEIFFLRPTEYSDY